MPKLQIVRLIPNLGEVSYRERLRSSCGALLGILLTAFVTRLILGASGDVPMLIAPMGASAVLLFGVPSSPLAQPWSIIGGNGTAALIGITCRLLIPDPFVAASMAVCLSIGAMFFLRCLHPPGGAVAITAVLAGPAAQDLGYVFALAPVLMNSGLLLVVALAYNNLTGHRYPHLRPQAASPHKTSDPAPSERVGFTLADLDEVLSRYDEVVDVDRNDLAELLWAAELRAYRRRSGGLVAADIMSRDVATVCASAELGEARRLLRSHRIKALPVIGEGRRVVGIVTQTDLLEAFVSGPATPIASAGAQRFKGRWGRVPAPTVGAIMTAPAHCAEADATLAELVPLMADAGLHHMPVVSGGRLVGIVTQSDVIAALFRGAAAREEPVALAG
ncbi:HPP family protein [Aurantimonas sp. VKM B-3413]|nr:HPP family protein [Aurantimonas sp. VKM B-3413]MCB8836331.1 HPP family protein [Aurantimonas sp. VKM B-3413]